MQHPGFEGVCQNAFVYVNNSFAGKCPYGYSNFYVDITKYLNYNEPNALKVVAQKWSSERTLVYRRRNLQRCQSDDC